jgi:CPA2 family monovalent cation:H+ antiporter-2
MKILQERREVDTMQGRTLLGILIFQDLAIIPMILITPIFMGSGGPDISALPGGIAKVAAILLLVIVLARWAIPGLLYRVARQKSRELFFITIAGICIIVAGLTNLAGLSFTLGAFVAGLLIGESDYNIDALSHIIPFRDVFASIFFLSIGMLLNTHRILDSPSIVLLTAIIVVLIIGIKILTGAFAAAVLGMPARVCIITGFTLCQVGEFSFVLAKTGLDSGFIPDMVYQIFLAAAIVTMTLTPFFMNAARGQWTSTTGCGRCMQRRTELQVNPGRSRVFPIISSSPGMASLERAWHGGRDHSIPYTVIELNPDVIRASDRIGDRSSSLAMPSRRKCSNMPASKTPAPSLSCLRAGGHPRIVHQARRMAPSCKSYARTNTSGTRSTCSILVPTRWYRRSSRLPARSSPGHSGSTGSPRTISRRS